MEFALVACVIVVCVTVIVLLVLVRGMVKEVSQSARYQTIENVRVIENTVTRLVDVILNPGPKQPATTLDGTVTGIQTSPDPRIPPHLLTPDGKVPWFLQREDTTYEYPDPTGLNNPLDDAYIADLVDAGYVSPDEPPDLIFNHTPWTREDTYQPPMPETEYVGTPLDSRVATPDDTPRGNWP